MVDIQEAAMESKEGGPKENPLGRGDRVPMVCKHLVRHPPVNTLVLFLGEHYFRGISALARLVRRNYSSGKGD